MAHPTINADALYQVRTTCPNCDEPSIVMVRLDAVLTTTRAEAFLSVKASPKKLEHDCSDEQATLFDRETGEILT
jgi:thymidine kinase